MKQDLFKLSPEVQCLGGFQFFLVTKTWYLKILVDIYLGYLQHPVNMIDLPQVFVE